MYFTFQIYTGAMAKDAPNSSKSLGHHAVMDLLQPYLGKGYRLFVDNVYTSILLFLDLLEHSTGTIVSTRKYFREGVKAIDCR